MTHVETPAPPVVEPEAPSSNGYVLWQGKSLLDGGPLVVVATGFRASKNQKTGAMIQIWIIRRDISPLEAIRAGEDVSICGNCKHRPTTAENPTGWGTCYVHVAQAPTGVFKTYTNGKYRPGEQADWSTLFEGRRVRLGAYGDPAAVPFEVWEKIVTNCDHHTGYTHQWDSCDPRLKAIVMASVDTPEEWERAQAKGWRTFRVRMPDEPLDKSERVCPASAEADHKVTCNECMACHGGGSQKASVAIEVHGTAWKSKRFVQIRVLQKQHRSYKPLLDKALKNRKIQDRYVQNGKIVTVIRDEKGNPVRYIRTPIEKPAGCV